MTASACESTQQESAKLGREAKTSESGQPGPVAPAFGRPSRTVKASDVTMLGGEGRSAVAVRLTSSAAVAQVDVPLVVEVKDASGKTVYTNQTGGLEASLQTVPVIPAHASVWWVDDQVGNPSEHSRVDIKVGTGRKAGAGRAPDLTTSALSVGEQSGIGVVSGKLVNHGRRSGSHGSPAVYVVALRGGHVVAAGRAVVGGLARKPGASAKFQAFLVGKPAGAKVEASPGPSAG